METPVARALTRDEEQLLKMETRPISNGGSLHNKDEERHINDGCFRGQVVLGIIKDAWEKPGSRGYKQWRSVHRKRGQRPF